MRVTAIGLVGFLLHSRTVDVVFLVIVVVQVVVVVVIVVIFADDTHLPFADFFDSTCFVHAGA